MSSWYDTKKLMTSLAKTAMAEAQKTIDKALDIDEYEEDSVGKVSLENESSKPNQNVTQEPTIQQPILDQWGSFSGSFFALSKDKKNKGTYI